MIEKENILKIRGPYDYRKIHNKTYSILANYFKFRGCIFIYLCNDVFHATFTTFINRELSNICLICKLSNVYDDHWTYFWVISNWFYVRPSWSNKIYSFIYYLFDHFVIYYSFIKNVYFYYYFMICARLSISWLIKCSTSIYGRRN